MKEKCHKNDILLRYRNREITPADIELVRATISDHYDKGRTAIALELCRLWNWRQMSGKLAQAACHDLLLRLCERGYVELPPQREWSVEANACRGAKITLEELLFTPPKALKCNDLNQVSLRLVKRLSDRELWRALVGTYHYLGDKAIVGEQLRYMAYLGEQVVACIGWASAALHIPPRDAYIGWDEQTKRQRLNLVVSQVRFLVLPWAHLHNLATKILSLNIKRLSLDWQQRYCHPVYLAETFVDVSEGRFTGTVYKAGNWTYLGLSAGRGKRGNQYTRHGRRKALYVYPLTRNAIGLLRGSATD